MTDTIRFFRVFSLPAFLMFAGTIGMHMVSTERFLASQVLKDVGRGFFLVSLGVAVTGFIWVAWRLWVLWRWESGRLNGECNHCGGSSGILQGPRCMMCGNKCSPF